MYYVRTQTFDSVSRFAIVFLMLVIDRSSYSGPSVSTTVDGLGAEGATVATGCEGCTGDGGGGDGWADRSTLCRFCDETNFSTSL